MKKANTTGFEPREIGLADYARSAQIKELYKTFFNGITRLYDSVCIFLKREPDLALFFTYFLEDEVNGNERDDLILLYLDINNIRFKGLSTTQVIRQGLVDVDPTPVLDLLLPIKKQIPGLQNCGIWLAGCLEDTFNPETKEFSLTDDMRERIDSFNIRRTENELQNNILGDIEMICAGLNGLQKSGVLCKKNLSWEFIKNVMGNAITTKNVMRLFSPNPLMFDRFPFHKSNTLSAANEDEIKVSKKETVSEIAKMRTSRGFTQKQVADELGITIEDYKRIENAVPGEAVCINTYKKIVGVLHRGNLVEAK